MAQDRQDQTGLRSRQREGIQEDPCPLHQLRAPKKTREDKLGDAPIPPRAQPGGERRRTRPLKSLLSDTAKAMRRQNH